MAFDDNFEMSNSPKERPLSNWAQVLSAASSLVTMVVAVWAIFFSPASQSVVDFLQSELALRNSKIATLEKSSEELNSQIELRQNELARLEERVTDTTSELDALTRTNKDLSDEKSNLSTAIEEQKQELEVYSANYEKLRIKFVAGKFYAAMQGSFVTSDEFDMIMNWPKSEVKVNVWERHVKFVKDQLQSLKGGERKIGSEVIRRFVAKCAKIGNRSISIRPLTEPEAPVFDYQKQSAVERDNLDREYERALEKFHREVRGKEIAKIRDVKDQIKECMRDIE